MKQRKKKNISPPTNAPDKSRKIAICIFLMIATFAVYWQATGYEFINFDDNEYLTNNQHVKSGLTGESIVWAFTKSHSANWHPVTWMSHMLDFELYELKAPGHHLTSLLFHIANTLLLFWVLLKMTGAIWRSGMVAALFALHPLNVESVVWIAERKNVLSTFFWFLTFWAYVRYVEKPTIKKYGLVALFLTLGLMSKPMLVTLPFVLLLLDFWPLKRWGIHDQAENTHSEQTETFAKLVSEKIPLFLLVVGSIIITYIAQKAGGAVRSVESFPLQERFMNAFVSYLSYLQKMLWPSGLSIFYPHPGSTLPVWKAVVCASILVGITFIVVKQIRRAPYLAVGWLWYLGTLVPVIGIVQVGEQAMADRYMYVPLIGIFIAMVWGLSDWAKNGKQKFLPISAGIFIPLLMALTWVQVSHWKNNITLFEHAIAATKNNYIAHDLLGYAQTNKGLLTKAIHNFNKAIEIKKNYSKAYNRLGNALIMMREYEKSIEHLETAIKIRPKYALAHNNLGISLSNLRKFEKAIEHYEIAIKLSPEFFVAHNNLANTLSQMGRLEEAIPHFNKAIELKPNIAALRGNLEKALSQIRNKKSLP
jgi:protein O-mannosyl-transferase